MGALYLSAVLWSMGEFGPDFFPLADGDEEVSPLGDPARVDEGGFKIRPPTDWDKKGRGARFLAPVVGRFRSSLVVERFPFDGDMDEFAEGVKSQLEEKYDPLRVVAEAPFEGGDLKGKTLTVDYTDFKGGSILDLRTRFYFIGLGGSMVVAVGTARRDRFDALESVLDASVESISIFGPGYALQKDGTCSFASEGYSFRLRADMSLRHRQEDGAVRLTIGSPGKVPVRLNVAKLDLSVSLRAQAKAYAAKMPGAEISRYEEAAYECWRILASKADSATYYFLLGGKTDRFLISTTARGEFSDVARDVIEHIVNTFKIPSP